MNMREAFGLESEESFEFCSFVIAVLSGSSKLKKANIQ